jgi:hypothetical protein
MHMQELDIINAIYIYADLFSYSYEVQCIQKLLKTYDIKSLAVAFILKFRYIDDVFFINNNQFQSYIDSIYPYEIEIKDTAVFYISFVFWCIIEIGH